MSTAVLSLGSNLGDRLAYLQRAVTGFQGWRGTRLVGVSPVYETEPWGPVPQYKFFNAVIIVSSPELTEWDWLRRGQALEQAAGRVRTIRWGPRTLDVDVVTVDRTDGPVFSEHAELLLPHPGASGRNTVLRPWLDIDPDAVLPGHGRVADLLAALGERGLCRRDDLCLLGDP